MFRGTPARRVDQRRIREQLVRGLGDERGGEEGHLVGARGRGRVAEQDRMAGRALRGDREVGVDRRADPAHVGHVGRAGVRVVALVLDPVGGHVGPEALGQDRVVAHRRGPAREGHLDGRVGRERGRLAQRPEVARIVCVVGLVVATDHEPGRRPVRDDVGGRPALADDPVDASGRSRSCWRHRPTETEEHDQRVEGVLAPPRDRTRRATGSPWKTTSTSSDASGWLSTWFRSHGWYSSAASSPSNRPSSIMICLAAAPLLGRRAEEDDLAGQLVGDRREGDGGADTRTRPSCCGRSRGRGRAARRTRRGSRSAARRRRVRRAGRARIAVERLPAGCSTAYPWRASASATQAAAWCSSKAGSGSAWIRCDSSMISSRAASTAAASRALASTWGSAGGVAVSDDNGRSRLGMVDAASLAPVPRRSAGRCSVCRQRSAERVAFGDERERDHEQRDRQLEEPLEAQHDEDRDDDARPRRLAGSRASSRRGRRSADAGRTRSAR